MERKIVQVPQWVTGTVTSLDNTIYSFVINRDLRVYVAHFASTLSQFSMPSLKDKVTLHNGHLDKTKNSLVLCEKSSLFFENEMNTPLNPQDHFLIILLKRYRLGTEDLKQVKSMLWSVYRLGTLTQLDPIDFIIGLISLYNCVLDENNIMERERGRLHSCHNNILKDFSIVTVSDCWYADDVVNIERQPYWTFGCHSKYKQSDRLLGLLCVCPQHGILKLKNTKQYMFLIVTGNTAVRDIRRFLLNRVVLIEKYTVFTEIFNYGIRSMHLLMCDISDIIQIDRVSRPAFSRQYLFDQYPNGRTHTIHLKFMLLNKSTVCLSTRDQQQCWFHISVIEKNGFYPSDTTFYLLVTFQRSVALLLQIGCVYTLYYRKILTTTYDHEVHRAVPKIKLYALEDPEAFFVVEDDTTPHDPNLIEAERVLSVIQDSNDMLSFVGIVKTKTFSDPLPSRTARKNKVLGYGTLGNKTHVIHFYADSKKATSFILYLNNWESIQMPHGLIPDMRVVVRNVIPQKGRYLKSCALTCFEVLGYESPIRFDTINLYSKRRFGKVDYVGCDELFPEHVIIISEINYLDILYLNVFSSCGSCEWEFKVYPPGPCPNCKCEDYESRKMMFTVTFRAYTPRSQTLIYCNLKSFFEHVLNFTPSKWAIWCEVFKRSGLFEFNKFAYYDPKQERYQIYENYETKRFHWVAKTCFEAVNQKAIPKFKLVCKRMNDLYARADGRQVRWSCIDILPK